MDCILFGRWFSMAEFVPNPRFRIIAAVSKTAACPLSDR
jgi:hypothetical protein